MSPSQVFDKREVVVILCIDKISIFLFRYYINTISPNISTISFWDII